MKHFFKHLLSGICLTMVSISALATPNTIDISLSPSPEKERGDLPSKGHRIPATPTICTIDFESHRIEASIPDEIIAYELWDEDGEVSFVSYETDYELVEYIQNVSGDFQLRLVTSGRTYVGYIDL